MAPHVGQEALSAPAMPVTTLSSLRSEQRGHLATHVVLPSAPRTIARGEATTMGWAESGTGSYVSYFGCRCEYRCAISDSPLSLCITPARDGKGREYSSFSLVSR